MAPETIAPSASAQSTLNPMPTTSAVDSNGVDLINWSYSYEISPISIGPSDQDPLNVSIWLPTERDSFSSNLRVQDPSGVDSTSIVATLGSKSWSFRGGGASDPGVQWVGWYYPTLQARDGTLIEYEDYNPGTVGPVNVLARKITKPNGEVLTFYNVSGVTRSVVSSRGYQVKYDYTSGFRSKITLINNAYEYCDPMAAVCSLLMAWPYVMISTNPRTYTNNGGQTWSWSGGLKSPGQTTPGINWTLQTYYPVNAVGVWDWRVTSVTRDGQTWVYSYPSSDPVLGGVTGQLMRVQDPLGNVKRYRRAWAESSGDPTTGEYESPGLLTKSINELSQIQTYSYNSQHLVSEVLLPEGNRHAATYDWAGNILTHALKAKPGSGIADATTTYAYATIYGGNECCDRPLTITDAKGNVTEYTYDPVHLGVLTETGPAPSAGAPRPMKRNSYSQHYAWVKNSSGSYAQAATPVWLLDSEKTCRTSATVSGACAAGASDEITISYDYGPNSGPNNLWLRGKVVTADGVSLRTCYGYDHVGNKISETSPRAGLTSCP